HHLCIGDEWMAEEIQKGLECPPQRLGLLRQIFKVPAWMVGIRLVRVKAPKKAEPLNPPPRETLIDNYKRGRTKLKDLALRIGRERLEQLIVVHPILGEYNGVQGVSFIHYHELRHYKQIREILQKLASR